MEKRKKVNRGIANGKSVKVDEASYRRIVEMAAKDRRTVSAQIAYLVDFYVAIDKKAQARA